MISSNAYTPGLAIDPTLHCKWQANHAQEWKQPVTSRAFCSARVVSCLTLSRINDGEGGRDKENPGKMNNGQSKFW
jgi:hypothetical protein